MYSDTESTVFVAVDPTGQKIIIKAERRVEYTLGRPPRAHAWKFRTADGRQIEFNAPDGCYVIIADGSRLTSTDPQQPQECQLH